MTKTIFHIGFHKTGSSWLQQAFFPSHPDLHPLCDSRHPWRDPFLSAIIRTPAGKFDCDGARKLLHRLMPVPYEQESARTTVVSAERLSGHPFSGGYDRFKIAERIHRCCAAARILCLVRYQRDMIASVYKQLIVEGYAGRLDDLFSGYQWKGARFDASFYEYDLVVKKYISLFGRDRVCVLPYELMQRDMNGFLQRICYFLGVPLPEVFPGQRTVNPGLTNRGLGLLRRVNHFRQTELHPFPLVRLHPRLVAMVFRGHRFLTPLMPEGAPVIDGKRGAIIEGYYRASNDRLASLVGWHFNDYATGNHND